MSDDIILIDFSLNSIFMRHFVDGANLVQAYLNQPFRFGNIPDSVAKAVAHQFQQPVAALENKSVQEVFNQYDLADYVSGLEPQLQRVQYAPGYLTNSNVDGNQYDFFLPGHYDPQIIPFAEETKQPIAPGELLGLGESGSFNTFEAPVLVITGCKFLSTLWKANDLPFVGGDCFATGNESISSIPAIVKAGFPHVALDNFAAHIQPNTGHGINLHYNATGAYAVMNTFLNAKGSGSS